MGKVTESSGAALLLPLGLEGFRLLGKLLPSNPSRVSNSCRDAIVLEVGAEKKKKKTTNIEMLKVQKKRRKSFGQSISTGWIVRLFFVVLFLCIEPDRTVQFDDR